MATAASRPTCCVSATKSRAYSRSSRRKARSTKSSSRSRYSIKWFEFPAGPQLLEALNANSVDFGYTGAPPPVFAQAGGVRFVYVGAEPSGRHAEAILVRSDSALHSVAELKGKRVALQKGSSANYLLLEALKKAGLRYEDVRPVYLAPPMRAPPSKAAPSMHGRSGTLTTRPHNRR